MNKQQNIPEGWKQMTLGDIGRVSMCKRVFKEETSPCGPIPFYKISTFGSKPDAYISEELYTKYKNKYPYPNKGDILISASGTIGRTVVFDGEKAYFQDSNIVWISNPEDKVLNKFLEYVYKKTKWISTDGGVVSRLYNGNLRSIKLLLPSLYEQNRIVQTLEAWDKYIRLIDQKIKLKKKIKLGLMQNLLFGKIRLPEFKDNWKIVSLGSLCMFQSGFAFSSKHFSDTSGIRIIRNRDLKNDSQKVYYNGNGNIEEYLIQNGDILIGMDGDFIACRWERGLSLLNQRVGKLINFRNCNKDFLFYFIQHPLKIIERETSSTTVKHLSSKVFEKYELPVPSVKEQNAITNVLVIADKELEVLKRQREIVISQKNHLLNNLITGQIRVPEFANKN